MNFKKILIFSSLYLPFAPLLEKYFPFQVFSNSFYITVLPIVTFFSLFLIKLKNFKSKDFYFLSNFSFVCVFKSNDVIVHHDHHPSSHCQRRSRYFPGHPQHPTKHMQHFLRCHPVLRNQYHTN